MSSSVFIDPAGEGTTDASKLYHKEPKVLHPMAAFGSVSSLTECIRINRLEHRLKPLVAFPHKHDFYQLLLVSHGEGEHEIDFEIFRVHKAALFVIRPGQVHTWELSPKSRGLVIEFNAETLHSKDPRWQGLSQILTQAPPYAKLDSKTFAVMFGLMQQALSEYEQKPFAYELLLHTQILQLLLLLARLYPVSSLMPTYSEEIFAQFHQLVDRHFNTEHSVQFYAEALNLSPKALTMRFYREQKASPRDLIQDRCLLEAKRLLAYSNLSIHAIADRLGFEDPNYFSRFFRKKMTQSPGAFRRAARHLC